MTYKLGISALFHNSSACLFRDDELVAAFQEERLSRIKGDASFPVRSIRRLLELEGLTIQDIAVICYYEKPARKWQRQLRMGLNENQLITAKFHLRAVEGQIREKLGFAGPVFYAGHHPSHLGNAIFQSGWESASFLTMDSVGEDETITWGDYDQQGVSEHGRILYPHSLGIFYSTITSYLGYGVNDEEFKVMGLAAHGSPCYAELLREKFFVAHGKDLKLNESLFQLNQEKGEAMFPPALSQWLGFPARGPGTEIKSEHKDLAASVQTVLESEVLQLVREILPAGCARLVFSGGVAHNSVLNQKLSQYIAPAELFIPAAPNDVGSSLGAVVIESLVNDGKLLRKLHRGSPYWGPAPTVQVLGAWEKWFEPLQDHELLAALLLGKVVAICRGSMEFGDRALGHRSILAHPGYPGIKDILNLKIKKREDYRPFAPIVPIDEAAKFFVMDESNQLMSKTYEIREQHLESLSGVSNVDRTARVQTLSFEDDPWLFSLLKAFGDSQRPPILLNTSLNLNGEPIVYDEQQALDLFLRSEIDLLVLEDRMLHRDRLPKNWVEAYRRLVSAPLAPERKTVYDFV